MPATNIVMFISIRPLFPPHFVRNKCLCNTQRTYLLPFVAVTFNSKKGISKIQSASTRDKPSEQHEKPVSNQGSKHLNTKVIVVPGKFDSFHIGHRHLAEIAAQNGKPTLMSFSGMSSALGWKPRPPVVADVERERVLRAWSVELDVPVMWRVLPFDLVREMAPECFLQFIVKYFGASGIVCGDDWKFGRGRSGDVSLLRKLAPVYDLQVITASPVDHDGIVSSTRVRAALQTGNVQLVASLLGRYHRAIGYTLQVEREGVICGNFVNMVPACGTYEVIVRVIGRVESFHATAFVFVENSEPKLCVVDANRIYCKDCEIYIDFVTSKV